MVRTDLFLPGKGCARNPALVQSWDMTGPALCRDSRSRRVDAPHLVVIGLRMRRAALGVTGRAAGSPVLLAVGLGWVQPCGVATRRRRGRTHVTGSPRAAHRPD